MQKVSLGQTDLMISRVGLGTVKIGRNQSVKYPTAFDLPNDKQVVDLLSHAKQLGINVIDTAPAYGCSEVRLGALLPGPRTDWVLMTKVGEEFVEGESSFHFTQQHTQMSIERSLQRLNTDYLDMVWVHSDGQDEQIIQQTDVLETLQGLKATGKIRAIGMSTKTVQGGLLALPHVDALMVTYNPSATKELVVIQAAHDQGKGIVIKKALTSGHGCLDGKNSVQQAFDFVFSEPGVSAAIIGTLSVTHLTENVRCAEQAYLGSKIQPS